MRTESKREIYEKVLIATFDNGEEMVFHDLLLFLEERRQIEVGDEFSIYTLNMVILKSILNPELSNGSVTNLISCAY